MHGSLRRMVLSKRRVLLRSVRVRRRRCAPRRRMRCRRMSRRSLSCCRGRLCHRSADEVPALALLYLMLAKRGIESRMLHPWMRMVMMVVMVLEDGLERIEPSRNGMLATPIVERLRKRSLGRRSWNVRHAAIEIRVPVLRQPTRPRRTREYGHDRRSVVTDNRGTSCEWRSSAR